MYLRIDPELSRLTLYFHEHLSTRIGETRGTKCQVPLEERDENSFSVARSHFCLFGALDGLLVRIRGLDYKKNNNWREEVVG